MRSGFLLFLFSGAVARSWACGSARLRARFGHIPSGELGPLLALGVKISAPAAGRDAGGPLHGGADQEHRRASGSSLGADRRVGTVPNVA